MAVFRFSEQRPVPMMETLTRRNLAYGGSLMMVEVEIPRGEMAPAHAHPHEQVSYLLSGRAAARIGDDRYTLQPGDSLYVPSGVEHEVQALDDCRVLDVFTPQREDFLK